jgi:transposase
MFFPEGQLRVHLYGQPVDMRKSFDGLYALTRHGLQQDPLSGHLFVFINRRATQMKVLYSGPHRFLFVGKALGIGSLPVRLAPRRHPRNGLDRTQAIARRH